MNKRVALGTHRRGGQPAPSLKPVVKFLRAIAAGSSLTNWEMLILVQPTRKHTIEKREKDRVRWENAASGLGGHLNLIYDLEYIFDEPVTLAWNKLHRHAFWGREADVFVYTDPNPPKWDHCYRTSIEKKLAHLVGQAHNMDYVIGDYTPVANRNSKYPTRNQTDVRFKITIEAGVKQMLCDRFPSLLAGWPLFDNLKRPRSEFHALSRRLYDELKEFRPLLPYDYGLQMLLVARVKGMNIRSEDLGAVPVTDAERYSPRKMMQQLRRVDFQLAQIQERIAKLQTSLDGGNGLSSLNKEQ